MRILCVGPLWRGSNAGGLFRALSRQNCLISVVDEFYYISLKTKEKKLKIGERLLRNWQAEEYNKEIRKQVDVFLPDVTLVYKGAFVTPETVQYAKKVGKVVMFYPDVSLTNHGGNIPKCIPLYELIFTTKTFGIKDMEASFSPKKMFFIPHGYDPDIHKIINLTDKDRKVFSCDASFIGTYSPKKDKWLSYLKEKLPEMNLKIWGSQWHKSNAGNLKSSIMGCPVEGDLYAAAIQCSKINLGILSEQVVGASSGDLITSRTFHIPGANGFMLHERNEESVLYFVEDKEAAFFDGQEELVEKTRIYLNDSAARDRIKEQGRLRAEADHSLDARAKTVMQQIALI